MKKRILGVSLLLILLMPVASHAIGFEFAIGGWSQSPGGDLSYKLLADTDKLDLENDLKYDDASQFFGRLKIDMPLLFPNIYLMATKMNFDGIGRKSANFKFGDINFTQNVDFYSEMTLDHYDIALYYGIPFVSTATAGLLNIDVGLNVRVIDFSAKIRQDTLSLEESESFTLPVPMVFVGAQVKPIERLSIEGEARVVSYGGNSLYSLIGRVKVKVFAGLFAAGGYRYDGIVIDEEDVDVDISFSGPFLEAGFQF